MAIECYYDKCPYHSCNDSDAVEDGPFCYQPDCLVPADWIRCFQRLCDLGRVEGLKSIDREDGVK
jgi:hypothetical protein